MYVISCKRWELRISYEIKCVASRGGRSLFHNKRGEHCVDLKRQMVSVYSSPFPTWHTGSGSSKCYLTCFLQGHGHKILSIIHLNFWWQKKDSFPKVLLSVPKCVRLVERVGTEVSWESDFHDIINQPMWLSYNPRCPTRVAFVGRDLTHL